MPSLIDPTKPADSVAASKADLRANLLAAKTEIETLQASLVGGSFTQAGAGAITRTVTDKLRDYDVSVTDFGAMGDGVADDTAAIQKAIDYVATTMIFGGHSRILMRGKIKYTPGSLDWSAVTGSGSGAVTMVVDGVLYPQGGPVLIDRNMHLVGIGGYNGTQFQLGPCCRINAATGQVGLWMQRAGNKSIRNVAVIGSSQPAILLTGTDSTSEATLGALYWLENVAALSGTGVDADCVRIQNVFWFWIKNFSFLAADPANGWAINVQDDNPDAISASGLGYVEDGVIAGRGLRIGATVASQTGYNGNMLFRNICAENLHVSMLTLDTVSPVDHVKLERCEMADTGQTVSFVNTVNARAQQLIIEECSNTWCTGPLPRDLVIRRPWSSINTLQVVKDATWPRKSNIYINGESDAWDAYRNAEMLPNLISAGITNLGAKQDATTWTSKTANFQVTASQRAPDGSLTAYLLEYTAGGTGDQAGRAYDVGSAPMTDGDFLIAGCWAKSAVAGQRMSGINNHVGRVLIGTGHHLLDGLSQDSAENTRHRMTDMGWVLGVNWWKWTGGDADWLVYDFVLSGTAYAYYVWKPFLLRVDQTLYGERDVARMAARLSLVDQYQAPGVLAQLPHHTLRTGIGVTGARPTAAAVGAGAQWFDATLNKPIWSDGTNWRDAIGNLI